MNVGGAQFPAFDGNPQMSDSTPSITELKFRATSVTVIVFTQSAYQI
jgi:hypothetical protein